MTERGPHVALAAAAVVSLIGCSVAPPGEVSSPRGATPSQAPSSVGAPDEGDELTYAQELVALSNKARSGEGLDPLVWSDCAAEQGQERASALVGSEELSHAPLGPVFDACGPVASAAENLSKGRVPAQQIVEAWLGSPGHRMNILDPGAAQAGAGCVDVGEDGFLCSMIFLG